MEHGDARDHGDPLFSQINKRNILPVSMLTRTMATSALVSRFLYATQVVERFASRPLGGALAGCGVKGQKEEHKT